MQKSRYQILIEKAILCRYHAMLCEGSMRDIWLKHANALEEMAANLPIVFTESGAE